MPSELKSMRKTGKLSRDDYWRLMQPQALFLSDFASIMEEGATQEVSLSHRGLIVTLTDGSRFHWDPADLREPTTLLVVDGVYEQGESELLRRLAKSVDLFVDVGANTGFYSVTLTRANSKLRTLAVEPVMATRAKLTGNIELNDLTDRVEIVPAALGACSGTGIMFLPKATGSVGSSLRDLHPDEASDQEVVQVKMLDELVFLDVRAGRATLVKIDVEGAESLVLEGSRDLISSGAIFVVELSRKWLSKFGSTAGEIMELFRHCGYGCYAIRTELGATSLAYPITEINSETQEVNFLFVPASRAASIDALLI
jgi:FkbM family methyltransferase